MKLLSYNKEEILKYGYQPSDKEAHQKEGGWIKFLCNQTSLIQGDFHFLQPAEDCKET